MSFHFSDASKKQLLTLHPDLQLLLNEVIKYFDFMILEGYRGKTAQDAAVKAGNSQTPWPTSKHNRSPSMAVDCAPYPYNPNKTADYAYMAGYMMCKAMDLYKNGSMKHRVRWGADWSQNQRTSGERFFDWGHLELMEE